MSEDLPPRFKLGHKKLVLPIVLSLCISLPAILSGYVMDDLVFTSPLYQGDMPFGYYNYIDEMRRLDILPWWTVENLELNFFRPLSSVALYVDFHLGYDRPLVAHLHSAVWFIVLLLGAARMLSSLLEAPRQQNWAFVFFALASYHTFLVGFIATRHALMGSTFAIWASAMYLDWHRTGEKKWLFVTAVLFGLGLLSGESALAFAGFALAHDMFFMKGHLKRKLAAFLPVGLAAAVYLLFYKSMGFGPVGSGMYIDPLTNPLTFLVAVPSKLLSMIGAFSVGMPAHLRVADGLEAVPVVTGAICLPLLLFVVFLAWKHLQSADRRMLKLLLVMGLFTALPGMAGIASGRAMSMSGIAFSAIMAISLTAIRFEKLSKRRKVFAWPLALLLAFGLLVMAPLSRLVQSQFMINWGSTLNTALAESAPLPCDEGAAVYLINGDFLTAYYAPFVVAKSPNQFSGNWHQLVSTNSDITVERTGSSRITIAHKGGSLLSPMDFDLFNDSSTALQKGTIVDREALRVTVVKRSRSGPTELSFHIPDLENPHKVCLLSLSKFALHPFVLPPIGRTSVVPFEPPTP